MFKRISIFVYGLVSYTIFIGSLVYAIGFVGNLGVPMSVDAPPAATPWLAALMNGGLLVAIALGHVAMRGWGFQRRITHFLPRVAVRSTVTLASGLSLMALFALWQPVGGVIWQVQEPFAAAVIKGLFILGWTLIVASTFVVNHFDLFGVRQVWCNLVGRAATALDSSPGFHGGWLLAVWATPTMTIGHLMLATLVTGFVLMAGRLEEREFICADRAGMVGRDGDAVPVSRIDGPVHSAVASREAA